MVLPSWRLGVLWGVCGLALLAYPGRSWWVFGALNIILGVLWLADVIAAPRPSSIGVERELPKAATVGVPTEMFWTISNTGGRRARVEFADALWPSLHASRRRASVVIDPSTRVRLAASLSPTRRGRFPLDDVTVRTEGPLRLSARQRSRTLPGVLRVYPAFPSRDAAERRLRRARMVDMGERATRLRGQGTEFDALRDYTGDDDTRRLDWAATARARKPIVRTYRTERNQTVMILLDNGRLMAGTVAEVPRVEHAMDAALALATVAGHGGDRVGMVAFDRQIRTMVAPAAGRAQISRMTEGMYRLDPALAESAYGSVFTDVAARFRRRSLFVLFTELSETMVHEALLPALSTLVRRHVVVVASVLDPTVDGWAQGAATAEERSALTTTYRQAAAISLGEQRQRAASRLRAGGAIVIDATPTTLASQVIDTYLDLKARGRL
jgi:uncharacterized protein (DUF58 family)